MKTLLSVCFTLLACCSHAQNYLLKSDNSTLAFKKISWRNDVATVKTIDKKEITIKGQDIIAFYMEDQTLLYRKPIVKLNEKTSVILRDSGYQYLPKVESGRINLYQETIYSSAGQVTHYYYAEKGDNFRNVLITGYSIKNRQDDFQDFKSFVQDDSQILEQIESEDFVYNEKNMLKIIKEYNLKYFTAPTTDDYKKTASIGIYTTAERKRREEITIKVNDSLEYRMPANYYPLPIALPVDKPSKVCITWNGGSSCELVQPVVFNITYYEVRNFLNGTYGLDKRTARDAKNYLARQKQQWVFKGVLLQNSVALKKEVIRYGNL